MKKLYKLVCSPGSSRFLFLLLFSIFLTASANAQTISGTITDGKAPIAGVTVQVKGKTTATYTNNAGEFTIAASKNDVLLISSVGYVPQEVKAGDGALSITLANDTQNLNEVIVTALGITKEARRIGYAATKVDPAELTTNRTPNLMGALQGKVAGVNIAQLGTGPGGTTKIRIRGQSSISGQNNPLIVINGIPVDNSNFGTNPTSGAVQGNGVGGDNSIAVRGGGITSDGGDGLSSINADDIESMTILKGAPAAALYGSRAKDGVIMITTKSRAQGRGIGVTYNLNYTNDAPLDFTDYQKEWGQGENGIKPRTPNTTTGQWSFGERINPDSTYVLFDGVVVPYAAQGSRIKEFYRNGQNLAHTVSLAAGSDKGGLYLSLANQQNDGITPNNTFNRKSVNLGFAYNVSDRFSVSGNVNYSNETNKNPPNIGNQDNSIPTTLLAMANTLPLWVLDAKKYNAQGNEYIYSRFMNRTNPYWVLAEQFNVARRDRMFGNLVFKYNILSWLYVQGRVGQDYWSRDQSYNNFPTGHASRAAAPAGFFNGMFTQESRRFRETNIDFLLSGTKEFGDFGVNLTVGGNQMRKRSDLNSVQVTDFIVRGLYTVQNGRNKDPLYSLEKKGVNSLYSSGELSYKRVLYLNGTVRSDWFTTLSEENRNVVYPSVSLAYVFTENFKPSWLSFGKLRAGYARAGDDNGVGAYSGQLFYTLNAPLVTTPSGAAVAVAGPNTTGGTSLPNGLLVPMEVAETEVGLELKMFDSRLNLDLSAYRKITTNQIVRIQVSDASGYVDKPINSGKSRNVGIEMLLNWVAVKRKDFTAELTINGSYNKTKVLSLLTNTLGERITVGTHVFNGEVRQVVGEEIGQIAGFGYDRNNKGERIFLANGVPKPTAQLVNFGSALPKWVGGFMPSFQYKGITFSALIDFKLGNKLLSGTNFNAYRHGLHQATLEGRVGGVVGVGVNQAGTPNTASAAVQTYWEHLRSQGIIEPVVYNGGFWKLRQISLGYDFTKYIPAKFPIKGVRLSLIANNVAILKKWVDNIDPETFGYSSDNLIGLESPGLPSVRSIGLNLNVKF
jgi:TonB-linked SusC/RagA family outer membrane protein